MTQLNLDFGKEPVVNILRSAGQGLKLQSGVQVKTSDYLKIGTEERQEFVKTHNVNTSTMHLIFGMTVLLSIQLQNEMGGVADTLDTIGSDLDDNLQQHDNEHGRDDEVSVLESDQEVEGANRVRQFQSDEETLGGSKRRRLELLKTFNSTEIPNMVAHLDEKEIRDLKALHNAPVLKPFNDSAADSNADTAEAYTPPRISDAAAPNGSQSGVCT